MGVERRLVSRHEVVLMSGARRNLRRVLMLSTRNCCLDGIHPALVPGSTCPKSYGFPRLHVQMRSTAVKLGTT